MSYSMVVFAQSLTFDRRAIEANLTIPSGHTFELRGLHVTTQGDVFSKTIVVSDISIECDKEILTEVPLSVFRDGRFFGVFAREHVRVRLRTTLSEPPFGPLALRVRLRKGRVVRVRLARRTAKCGISISGVLAKPAEYVSRYPAEMLEGGPL